MIDRATIDRIYATADIVEVISDYVTLRKKGVNYQACCPFHNEKTPSFVVSPSKGVYKCFGCGKGGNAITFVMEHESLSYVEALKVVARKYGIEVQEREMTNEDKERENRRESMMAVNDFAANYFVNEMHRTDEGRSVALSYLRGRGVSDEMIARFQLGYCPSAGDAMSREALAKGYKEEFLVDTGLTIKRETGGYYDRFCGRVIFPVHTVSGRVTAFGGRTMRTDKNVAKYVNSPESEVYSKKNVLYGLFFAKKAIQQQDCAIMVEGYLDVISMHQAGIENVVASSGTSLTVEQIQLIKRFTRNMTVIYDGDSAGLKASLRGIDMILREGMNVRVVQLPEGDDPDTFARRHTSDQLKAYIADNERDFITFKANLLMAEAAGDPIKRAGLIGDIVTSIAQIPDPIPRAVYVKECAELMQIDEQVLLAEVARKRVTASNDKEATEFIRRQQSYIREQKSTTERRYEGAVGSSVESLERELSKYLIKYGHCDFDFKEGREIVQLNVAETILGDLENNELEFRTPVYYNILQTFRTLFDESEPTREIPQYHFINHPDPEVCKAAVDLYTAEENYVASKIWEMHDMNVESEQERLSTAVPRAVILYKAAVIKAIIADLTEELKKSDVDENTQMELLHKISILNDERRKISDQLERPVL